MFLVCSAVSVITVEQWRRKGEPHQVGADWWKFFFKQVYKLLLNFIFWLYIIHTYQYIVAITDYPCKPCCRKYQKIKIFLMPFSDFVGSQAHVHRFLSCTPSEIKMCDAMMEIHTPSLVFVIHAHVGYDCFKLN